MSIRQHRTDDITPNRGCHVGIFIEHHPVEVGSAKSVRVIGSVESNACSVVWKVDMEFAFVGRCVERDGVALEVEPGDVFGLDVVWRDVGIAAVRLVAVDGVVDEVGDTGDGLATAAVGDDDGPALAAAVEGPEDGARSDSRYA